MRTPLRGLAIFAFVFYGSISTASSQEPERIFLSGYAGTLPGVPRLLARTYFDDPNIRALILDMETGPVSRDRIMAATAKTEFTIDDLIRVSIVREEDSLFHIDFNYFTLKDMQSVSAASEKYIPSLVAAYMARKVDFEQIYAAYPAISVSSKELAFVLIAGFSLNWDGLKLTEERGWRRAQMVEGETATGERWGYSFWASEVMPDSTHHGYFWGSSTFPGGAYNFRNNPVDYSFSSFGDPYSDPRMNFPDLLYLPGNAMAEPVEMIAKHIGLEDRSEFGDQFRFSNALGLDLTRTVAAALFALRDHPKTEQHLISAMGAEDTGTFREILGLLEEIGYIEKRDQQYYLLVPVLDHVDGQMVSQAIGLSREILSEWLDQNYAAIKSDLSGLTALRHGVAFESLFTQIWHEMFGRATHDLVAAAFLADPYGENVRYKGSLSVLWRKSVYEHTPF